MSKFDQGGGCPCGLYRECSPDCEHYEKKPYDCGGSCEYTECPTTCPNNPRYKGEKRLSDEIFDFGFTAVTEQEIEQTLPAVQDALSDRERAAEMERRLDKLHAAILPLLENLRKNPESEYIRWPNREEKIDAFETHIAKIVDGDI